MTNAKNSMITGNPVTAMLSFALPMIMANLFQQLYNLADSLIVGNYVGENALAAVGASFAITMLFICVAMGFGMGCSVVISQLLGAGKIIRRHIVAGKGIYICANGSKAAADFSIGHKFKEANSILCVFIIQNLEIFCPFINSTLCAKR